MRLKFDPEANAAYIYLLPSETTPPSARTVPVDPIEVRGEINLDFDRDGKLIGIEILDAKRFLDSALLDDEDL